MKEQQQSFGEKHPFLLGVIVGASTMLSITVVGAEMNRESQSSQNVDLQSTPSQTFISYLGEDQIPQPSIQDLPDNLTPVDSNYFH